MFSIRFLIVFQVIYFVNGQDQVRLAGDGATASKGRVEVLHDGVWGTVCDDKFQNNGKATNVVCNMLGFSNGGTPVNSSVFGPGTGKIWLDEVTCDGIEPKLEFCPSAGWGVTDCSHDEDVGVICVSTHTTPNPPVFTTKPPAGVQPSNCSEASSVVRLIGPENRPGIGFVEVSSNGNWHSVCDDFWDLNDAQVICGMLCYDISLTTAGLDQSMNYIKENVSSSILLDDVGCDGTETNIFSCSNRGLGVHNCKIGEYASVQCVPPPPTLSEAPVPILQCENWMFTVSFSRSHDPSLEAKHLSIFHKYTGPCHLQKSMETNYVVMKIPFTDCGTNETSNSTHLMYINTIFYNYTSQEQNIVRKNTFVIEVICEFPRNKTNDGDGGIQPQSQFVTQVAPGQFHMKMKFYTDNSFKIPLKLTELLLGDLVVVTVTMNTTDSKLNLIVPTCIATPVPDRNYYKKHTLFEDNCIKDRTVSITQINMTAMSFSFNAFKFLDSDSVYLHCKSVVCRVDEKTEMCDRTCASTGRRRKRRSTGNGPSAVLYVSSPRMKFKGPSDSEEAPIIREWNVTKGSNFMTSTRLIPTTKELTTLTNPSTTKSTLETTAPWQGSTKSTTQVKLLQTKISTQFITTTTWQTTTRSDTHTDTTNSSTWLPTTSEQTPTTTTETSKSSTWRTVIVRATTNDNDFSDFNTTTNPSTVGSKSATVTTSVSQEVEDNIDSDAQVISVKPIVDDKKSAQNNLDQKEVLGEINHAGLLDFDLTSGSRYLFDSYLFTLLLLTLSFIHAINLVV